MKQSVDVVIVIPVGPGCAYHNLEDTVESIKYYITGPHKIIIADDSQKGTGKLLQERFTDIHIITTHKNLGKVAGLYINLSVAYSYALVHYDFKVLMKMDDDALVIGSDPQEAAIKFFDNNPGTGMAGRYISGQLSVDCFGNIHDNYWPRKQIIKDVCSWKLIRRPTANWNFRKMFLKAVSNGYELGENIQGGVYFFSKDCLQQLSAAGLLPMDKLRSVNFGEDLLFSLLVKAIGMELGDIGGKGQPVGCAWQGLPAAPATLHNNGKRVIHSIRSWKEMKEADIRRYFKRRREDGVLGNSITKVGSKPIL